MPPLKAVVWFNQIDGYDYRIESSAAAQTAFAQAVASPRYLSTWP